jgi:hypothetical protein
MGAGWFVAASRTGTGNPTAGANARVAATLLLISATVKAPFAMASSAQIRTAEWKARRQDG